MKLKSGNIVTPICPKMTQMIANTSVNLNATVIIYDSGCETDVVKAVAKPLSESSHQSVM
jgi:hypothetical protein